MKALICSEFGAAADMRPGELPAPVPGDGQVLIEVKASGISYVDALMVRNKHQNKHELPFAPGMAVAGVVAACGNGVSDMGEGDRVMALVYDGGLAEFALAPQAETFPVPAGLSFESAAAIANGFLTPHAALRWEAQLEAGETMLVLGAAGTVGSAAVAIGNAMGATVIAAASSDEKLAVARANGAAHLINYTEQNLAEAVRELTGSDGVNVVFDPVGGDLYEAAFKTLGWGARYVIIGFAGGAIPQFAANRLLVKNRKALGFVLMYYRRYRTDRLRQTAEELAAMAIAGQIDATPHREAAITQAGAAIDGFFNRQATGNTVVTMQW